MNEDNKGSRSGWLEVDGNMPRLGYFADRSWVRSGQRLQETRLKNNEARLAVENLWPLEVGKKAQYTGIVASEVGYRYSGRVSSTANVESTELVEIYGFRLRAFVIMVHSRVRWGNAIHSDFMRRLWYSPDIGMVVKENFEWTKGERKGRRFDYVLRSVRLADGTRIFPPPAATPVVRVEAGLIEERLESVQDLLEQGLITKEEAAEKRQEILDEL